MLQLINDIPVLKSWGRNTCGQLGINSTDNKFIPQEVIFEDENNQKINNII